LRTHSYPQRFNLIAVIFRLFFVLLLIVEFKLIGRKADFNRDLANFNQTTAFLFIQFFFPFQIHYFLIRKIEPFYPFLRTRLNQLAKYNQPLTR